MSKSPGQGLANQAGNSDTTDTRTRLSDNACTNALRIDEEKIISSASHTRRQGPDGEETCNKVSSGKIQMYPKGRPRGLTQNPCSPFQYGMPQMPTINENPSINKNPVDTSVGQNWSGDTVGGWRREVYGMYGSGVGFWSKHLDENNQSLNIDTLETPTKQGADSVKQPSSHQRPYRTRKQPSLENMLGVSSLTSRQQNSFNVTTQPLSNSSSINA